MGIAQKVSREFADGVRSRGQSYFAKGRVAISSAKAGEIVVAKVKGTEPYKVKLRVRGGRLHASCTCPYFGPEGEPCKHLWATILAADAKGLLQAAPVRPLRLVPDVRYHVQQQQQQALDEGLPPPPALPPQGNGGTFPPRISSRARGRRSGRTRIRRPISRRIRTPIGPLSRRIRTRTGPLNTASIRIARLARPRPRPRE